MKQNLMDRINVFLLKAGFIIKNLRRSCFDILARREEHILLIKALEDANSISEDYTREMGLVASYVGGSPLILAEKAGGKLEDDIIYLRFDIYTLNTNTFFNCVNNKFPFIRSGKAGLTTSIFGKRLREKREEMGYSVNALSRKIGVTSRMIRKYESGDSEVTLNKAEKIHRIFGIYVFSKVDIFRQNHVQKSSIETEVSQKFAELGFRVSETKKTPFDIIARKENDLILTEVSDKVDYNIQSLSRLVGADNLVIFNKKKPKNIPAMTKKEFMEFDRANELVKFLKDF